MSNTYNKCVHAHLRQSPADKLRVEFCQKPRHTYSEVFAISLVTNHNWNHFRLSTTRVVRHDHSCRPAVWRSYRNMLQYRVVDFYQKLTHSNWVWPYEQLLHDIQYIKALEKLFFVAFHTYNADVGISHQRERQIGVKHVWNVYGRYAVFIILTALSLLHSYKFTLSKQPYDLYQRHCDVHSTKTTRV